ncbi:SGNH/GDSL hydrolase family protein [Bifidobacterium apicola]|uniref:SGNH/GDSL hydrolase family protein n=1 Tax=Bifidobacterium apicola TaxID=3230739 RepID=UPI0036F3266C
MLETPRHHIKYPAGTDLVKNASSQFRAMAESIDDNVDALPAQITVKVDQATQDTKRWRDEAEQFAAKAGTLQDNAVAALIRKPDSATRKALAGSVCLWIGDSFTQGYMASSPSKRYSRLVSDQMGWIEVNYAVGGAGYIAPGEDNRNFLQQAKLAKSNGVEPDVVIVAGCQNDYNNPTYEAAVECLSWCKTTWPQARLVCITSLWCAKGVPDYVLARSTDATRAARVAGAQVIPYGYQWLYGDPTLVDTSGGNHPNDAGYRHIADMVIQGLNKGTAAANYDYLPVTPYSSFSVSYANLSITEGIVTFSAWFTKKGNNASFNDMICTLDKRAAPGKDQYIPLFTNGGNSTMLGKIYDNGILQLASWPQGVSSTQIIIPTVSWRVGQ